MSGNTGRQDWGTCERGVVEEADRAWTRRSCGMNATSCWSGSSPARVLTRMVSETSPVQMSEFAAFVLRRTDKEVERTTALSPLLLDFFPN